MLLLLLCACFTAARAAAAAENPAALRGRATSLAYNLDYDDAVALLRRALSMDETDPASHRSLASVLWLKMLFVRGAVTVDHYLGSLSRARVEMAKPPPDLDAEFRAHVTRAIELAAVRVSSAPRSAAAHYDLGAAVGLHASYVATVEGRLLSGFKAARRAYDAHERALELDPSRKGAGLIVGTYRYIVSTMSLPLRMMAYVAGFGGGRERGIAMIEETAASGGDNRTDAMFALVLVYNRERRYDDALRVLRGLRQLYPRNRLVLLEAGATAIRAGQPGRAETMLSEGLAMLPSDHRRRIPGEEALWKYKRGTARRALERPDAAIEDLRAAAIPEAQPWVHGRARVELGRLFLQRGDRQAAAREARDAQALCEKGNDAPCVNDARQLLRKSNGR
jgi:tetratricopeptide (TPR) repeat protein